MVGQEKNKRNDDDEDDDDNDDDDGQKDDDDRSLAEALGSSPHTDWGTLTVSLQDDRGGLQTHCRMCDAWSDVDASPPSSSSCSLSKSSNGGGEEPLSLQDFQAGKEQRQRMKDDQCRILSLHNSELISSLNRAEEDLDTLQREQQKLEEENKALRESNFNLQAKTSSAEGRLEEAKSECDDFKAQLKTMMTKSAELISLLEQEEANTAKISTELETCKSNPQSLGEKYNSLIQSSREFEETAVNAIRENRLNTSASCRGGAT